MIMFDVSQIYRYSNCCVLGLGLELRYLMPLSTIFQLYREISFTDGGNQSTWRKPLIFHMLLRVREIAYGFGCPSEKNVSPH
jgi:hypothetical protein